MWRATFLFLFFYVSFAGYTQSDALSQTNEKSDVSVVVRHPDQKSIDKFLNDDDFRYEEDYVPGFFERLLTWILRKIFGNARFDNSPSPLLFVQNFIIIPAAILLIVFAGIKLAGIKATGIFGRKAKKSDLTYMIDDENVKGSEFDELIAKALDDGNYRLAVRYLYLKTLQQLDLLQLIVWNPNKTNRSYVEELTDKSLIPSFREKIFLFELIWYGEYQIKESDFVQIRHTFSTFNQKLQQSTTE